MKYKLRFENAFGKELELYSNDLEILKKKALELIESEDNIKDVDWCDIVEEIYEYIEKENGIFEKQIKHKGIWFGL